MTRASDLARLIGAGATINDGTTITTADNTAQLELVSTDADSGIGPHQVFYRNSSSPADADLLCELDFRGRNDNSQDVNYATVNVKANDVTDGEEDGEYILQVMTAGSVDTTMHIKPAEIVFNEDSIDRDFRVESDGNANMLFVDGGNDRVGIGTNSPTHQLQNEGTSYFKDNVFIAGGLSKMVTSDSSGNPLIFGINAVEKARLTSTGKVGIGTSSPTSMLTVSSGVQGVSGGSDAAVRLINNFDNPINEWVIEPQIQGVSNTGLSIRDVTDSRIDMAFNGSGNVLIGTTSSTGFKMDLNANGGAGLFTQNIGSGTIGVLTRPSANHSYNAMRFDNSSASIVGTISVGTGSTSFNTTSDYRLKENVTYDFDATTRLKQLKPCRFNFKIDSDTTIDGFLAHEVSSIVPEAITGEKDAMTEEVLYVDGDEIPDGKKVGDVKEASKIAPQGIDQSKLVPLLVKTIQELEARIATLESK